MCTHGKFWANIRNTNPCHTQRKVNASRSLLACACANGIIFQMSENTNPCHTPNTKCTGFGLSVLNFSHRFQTVILQKQQSPNQFDSSIQHVFRIREDRPKVQVVKVHNSPVRAAPLIPPHHRRAPSARSPRRSSHSLVS